ncbi:ethanolamine utilization protein EutQ, partial [Phenoliferia sp. Uapishka_3]
MYANGRSNESDEQMSIVATKSADVGKLIALGNGAEIDDVYVTDDAEKPMSGGIFTVVAADEPFVYTYKYHELKVILEGELCLEDRSTGIKILAKAGDVIKIAKGTTVTFSSPSAGKAFYVGQRALRDF